MPAPGLFPHDSQPPPSIGVGGGIDFDQYDKIPVEMSGQNCPKPIDRWTDIELGTALQENIRGADYRRPTPVQRHALPAVAAGRDLMACAQTGSGKTAAFLFPMIAKLIQGPLPDVGSRKALPRGLVLAPTRELACQIFDEARKFCEGTGLKAAVAYGGAPMGFQLAQIERGVDILVATPGRLCDMMERARVTMSRIKYLVLDEADRMLDMGFEPQVRHIVEDEEMPKAGQRQTLMFSATFPKEIQTLAADFLHDYVFLAVGRVGSTTDLVKQEFVQVGKYDKMGVLYELLKQTKGSALIFVETKRGADQLEDFLLKQNVPVTSIHGDREQSERTIALRTFATGQTPFLIATNVAARGLDIPNIARVINYDMPNDVDDYVHRIGRTGRAGKKGLSTAFISDEDINILPKIVELCEESHQEVPPWVRELASQGMYGGGGSRRGGGGRGGHRFGGRDVRRDEEKFTSQESWGSAGW